MKQSDTTIFTTKTITLWVGETAATLLGRLQTTSLEHEAIL
jgi:hypothetical protein